MSTIARVCVAFTATASFALFLASAGCNSNKGAPAGGDRGGSQKPAPAASNSPVPGSSSAAPAGENPGLAKLSAEDRALAEKQKTCPVTDGPLGSMGAPVKVTLRGQTVFLCCAGCEEDLKKDPEKYLAKLKKADTK